MTACGALRRQERQWSRRRSWPRHRERGSLACMSTAALARPRSVAGDVLAALKAAVGPKGWTDSPDEIGPHLVDWRGVYRGTTPLLLRPASTAEVSRLVEICADARVAIVPQGGNTGLAGGAIPSPGGGEILLS